VTIAAKISEIRERMNAAAVRSGRDPEAVKLVAVSKMHPAEAIREAFAGGARAFGENKVQEGEEKIAELGRRFAKWHLIGRLQSNKARKAARLFDVIHTLDSVDLGERLERICAEENIERLTVLAQVDLTGGSHGGVPPEKLDELADHLVDCKRLHFAGLMTLPPFFAEAEKSRPYFRKLRELAESLAARGRLIEAPFELSMGMTNDFEVAIEEGATLVRIGTAIFGERDHGRGQ
jgi:pyridoxal phosphate enzyme (YggS family)